ncbi:MAG: hypothetical protein ABIY37_15495, partial [Devosia sp.]
QSGASRGKRWREYIDPVCPTDPVTTRTMRRMLPKRTQDNKPSSLSMFERPTMARAILSTVFDGSRRNASERHLSSFSFLPLSVYSR